MLFCIIYISFYYNIGKIDSFFTPLYIPVPIKIIFKKSHKIQFFLTPPLVMADNRICPHSIHVVFPLVNDRNGISPKPNRNRNTDFLPNRNRTETETQYRNYIVVNTTWWLSQITTNSILYS